MNRSTKTALTRWLANALAAVEANDCNETRRCICRAFAEVEMARQDDEARSALTRRLVQVPDRPAEGAMQ